MIFGWRVKLIAAAVVVTAIFGVGWKTRDAFCDSAEANRQVSELRRQIAARDEAAVGDQKRAEADAKVREQLQEVIRELEGKISAGECFSADDVGRIRSLWLRRK